MMIATPTSQALAPTTDDVSGRCPSTHHPQSSDNTTNTPPPRTPVQNRIQRAGTWAAHRRGSGGLAVIGHSRGSEIAQLVAANDSDVAAVVLLTASPVAWPGLDSDRLGADIPSWTVGDSIVPTLASGKFFGQVLREHRPPIVAFQRALSDTSAVAGAMLPITKIRGPMLWITGDSDAVWPANELAARAIAWRSMHHVAYADRWARFASGRRPPART